MTWTKDELRRIGEAQELEIAPLRRGGASGAPLPIWVVRVGDDLYVRSWRGRAGSWFRATQLTGDGRITAGGVEKDVQFVAADEELNGAVDDAYRSKYRRYAGSYLEPMLRPEAHATTLRLVPRDTEVAQ